jgi:hypothetical protein
MHSGLKIERAFSVNYSIDPFSHGSFRSGGRLYMYFFAGFVLPAAFAVLSLLLLHLGS